MRGGSDMDLMALIASGDPDALVQFYDRHGRTAYAFAYRVTRDSHLAEDVTQEAFLTVWRRAGEFDPRRARPSSWLMSITHHRAVDVARRERVRRTESADTLDSVRADTNVPREAWLAIQAIDVRDALAALTECQRQVIEMCYFQGFTQSELARHLGLPIGTIKSRTHAALRSLHKQLERRGVTLEEIWSLPSYSG
jgi:RNA polymerase sigma-70 factor (ECF subfamily)